MQLNESYDSGSRDLLVALHMVEKLAIKMRFDCADVRVKAAVS